MSNTAPAPQVRERQNRIEEAMVQMAEQVGRCAAVLDAVI